MTHFQLICFPASQTVALLVSLLARAGIARKVDAHGSESTISFGLENLVDHLETENRAAPPALSVNPEAADCGESVHGSTIAGAAINRTHLIKLGSATQSENQDQCLEPLSFAESGTVITFPVPSARNSTPSGRYLLFLFDEQGVPSKNGMSELGQPLIELVDRIISTLEEGALESDEINLQPSQWITDPTGVTGKHWRFFFSSLDMHFYAVFLAQCLRSYRPYYVQAP